jgi:hypothetical protein
MTNGPPQSHKQVSWSHPSLNDVKLELGLGSFLFIIIEKDPKPDVGFWFLYL